MKRRLKLQVIIDFNKLLKRNGLKQSEETNYHITEEENRMIYQLVEKIGKISKAIEIEMVIEDLKTQKFKSFEKSSKMGSACANTWKFK